MFVTKQSRVGAAAGIVLTSMLTVTVTAQPIESRVVLPWLPQPDKAALMVVAAHPDDEGIFFGGALPYYTQVRQLPTVHISMTSGESADNLGDDIGNRSIREEELRKASWVYGLRSEPVFARFSDSIEPWDHRYDADNQLIAQGSVDYLAEQIRLYRPDVIITHDTEGEYGHSNHAQTGTSILQAVALAANPVAAITGTPWEAKKVYVNRHNRDHGNLTPINDFYHSWETAYPELGGQTPLQVADLGLAQMKTQVAGLPFFLPTRYAEDWVLARSTVGADTLSAYPQPGDTIYSGMDPTVGRDDFFQHVDVSGYGPPPEIKQQIITPVAAINVSGADAATDLTTTAQASVDRLIDASGLSEPVTIDNLVTVTHEGFNFDKVFSQGLKATTFLTNDVGGDQPYFNSQDPVIIDFDLGGRYSLDAMYLWQYNDSLNGGAGNGVREMNIQVSTDGGATFNPVNAALLEDANPGNTNDPVPFNTTTGENLQKAQGLPLGGVEADTVRLTINDNFYFSELFGGQRVGLGEVRFLGSLLLDGDLNGDGFVGIDDLNIVLGNWNQSIPPDSTLADPSGDGFVGIDDLNVVLGNWNTGTPPTDELGLIPEPNISLVLLLGALTLPRQSNPNHRKTGACRSHPTRLLRGRDGRLKR